MWRPKLPLQVWVASAVAILLLGGVLLLVRKPDTAADEETWFADVTEEMGLDFVHDAGDVTTYQLPQINGSGVALFDYDGDDRLDLYLLNAGGPGSSATNRLYKNLPNGTFQDVTAGSGLGI